MADNEAKDKISDTPTPEEFATEFAAEVAAILAADDEFVDKTRGFPGRHAPLGLLYLGIFGSLFALALFGVTVFQTTRPVQIDPEVISTAVEAAIAERELMTKAELDAALDEAIKKISVAPMPELTTSTSTTPATPPTTPTPPSDVFTIR